MEVFTTGEVANICGVARRTVIAWFDAGHLKGYRLPDSGDRRIFRSSILELLEKYGMPADKMPAAKEAAKT